MAIWLAWLLALCAVKLDGYVLNYIVNDKSVFVVLFLCSWPYFRKLAVFLPLLCHLFVLKIVFCSCYVDLWVCTSCGFNTFMVWEWYLLSAGVYMCKIVCSVIHCPLHIISVVLRSLKALNLWQLQAFLRCS